MNHETIALAAALAVLAVLASSVTFAETAKVVDDPYAAPPAFDPTQRAF